MLIVFIAFSFIIVQSIRNGIHTTIQAVLFAVAVYINFMVIASVIMNLLKT